MWKKFLLPQKLERPKNLQTRKVLILENLYWISKNTWERAKKATRTEDKKLFGVECNVLVVNVVLAVHAIYALCEIFSYHFIPNRTESITITSRRKLKCLMLCLILYLAAALPLFWKRFEVCAYKFIWSFLWVRM